MLIGSALIISFSMATMTFFAKQYGGENKMLLVHTTVNAINVGLLPFVTNLYVLYFSLFTHFFLSAGFVMVTFELMRFVDKDLHGAAQGG